MKFFNKACIEQNARKEVITITINNFHKMKKTAFFLLITLISVQSQAQEYLIAFTVKETGTALDSILVENLDKGTALTLRGEDILYLREMVSSSKSTDFDRDHELHIYPNPMTQYSNLEFDVSSQAEYVLEVYHASGQMVAHDQVNLSPGTHAFRITGLSGGIFTIRIISPEDMITGKILSLHTGDDIARLTYQGKTGNVPHQYFPKNTQVKIQMQYNQDERLKFTGFSGSNITILTNIPASDQTLSFEFADCIDGDNNTYAAVQIGTQLWMAENLKTTRYSDGKKIPHVTKDTVWRYLTTPAYCWYDNDSAMNAKQYGALYDWYAVAEENLCPSGWHAPSNEEWDSLVSYLTDNGYGFEEGGGDYGKSLASISEWVASSVPGTVGNDPEGNNASGFLALPAGYRNHDGTYKDMGISANWWSYTGKEPDCYSYFRSLTYNSFEIESLALEKEFGFSVRCLKD